MIVKCQISLANNVGYPTMLFYTQDREQLGEFRLTWQWEEQFKSYGTKFYADVRWATSHVIPEFLGKVDNQPW
jgi:hypothetical protein